MVLAAARRLLERTALRQVLASRSFSSDAAAPAAVAAWWGKGLGFSCTQCGKCCTGHKRAVYISETEAQARLSGIHGPEACRGIADSLLKTGSTNKSALATRCLEIEPGAAKQAGPPVRRVPGAVCPRDRRPPRVEAGAGHGGLHLPRERAEHDGFSLLLVSSSTFTLPSAVTVPRMQIGACQSRMLRARLWRRALLPYCARQCTPRQPTASGLATRCTESSCFSSSSAPARARRAAPAASTPSARRSAARTRSGRRWFSPRTTGPPRLPAARGSLSVRRDRTYPRIRLLRM